MIRRGLPQTPPTPLGRAVGVTAAMAIDWLLTATYILPWYDALAWAPLALAGASVLDQVLVVHTAMLIWAFLPGRDLPLSPVTDALNRPVHVGLSPVTLAAFVVFTNRWLVRSSDSAEGASSPSAPSGRSRSHASA